MSEQRKAPRAPLKVYVNKYVAGIPYMSRASDISPEGVSLSTLIEPRCDERHVAIQFQLPEQEEVIYAEGEVVRQRLDALREGSGIRFTLLTERHRRLIHQFVEKNA